MLADLDGVRKLAQACACWRTLTPTYASVRLLARLAQAKLAQALGGMMVACPEITHKVNYDLI